MNYSKACLRTVGKKPANPRPLLVWPFAKGSTVKLFILAGHRNMEGERALTQELRALPGQEDWANGSPKATLTTSKWEPIAFRAPQLINFRQVGYVQKETGVAPGLLC